MKQLISIMIIMWSCIVNAQTELWQLQPWAADSSYVLGANASGEPVWVSRDSLIGQLSIDSTSRVFYITNGADTVKFLDRGILSEVDGSTTNELSTLYNQSAAPSDPKKGDVWFNTDTKVTTIYDGTSWVEIDNPTITSFPLFSSNLFVLSWTHKGLNTISTRFEGGNGIKITQGTAQLGNHAIFKVDSLWIGQIISDSLATITTETDSIQRVGNVISLKVGEGSVNVADLVNAADSTVIVDGWGITSVESPDNTYNLMADSSQVATPYDLSLKQDKLTGANKRIPYFTGTSTLSNSDNLVFDNATKYLGIGTPNPDATIHMTQATGNRIRFTDPSSGTNYKNWQIFAGSGADERNLSFQSLSDLGTEYNFMTWRKATNSQVISNLYIPHLATSSGTEVMTMDNVGHVWRSGLKTINSNSLFGSGDITTFTLPSLTAGSVLFSNGSTISQDNSNLFWDDLNNRLGIGTLTPTRALTVNGLSRINIGTNNLFINGGNSSLSGNQNVALGDFSLTSLTSGSNNYAAGYESLNSNTSGSNNVGLGFRSLFLNQSGYENMAIGFQSLYSNVSGFRNVAIGSDALSFSTTEANTAIGYGSLGQQTSGYYNTAVGYFSGRNLTNGNTNTIFGWFAGGTGSSSQNVDIGYYAGQNSTGTGNIRIGYNAGQGSSTYSNRLYIENSNSSTPLIGGDFANDRIGINTPVNSIANTLHVTGGARITDLAGSGTRMVTANASGDLSTQTIPVNTDAQTLSFGTKSGANVPFSITGGNTVNFTDGVGTSGVVNSATSFSVDLVGTANSVKARVGTGSGTLSDVALATNQLVGRGSGNVQAVSLGTGLTFNASNNLAFNQSYDLLTNDANASSQTLDATYRKVDFNTTGTLEYSANTTTDQLTLTAGTYEVSYNGDYTITGGSSDLQFIIYAGSTNSNGSSVGMSFTSQTPPTGTKGFISKTVIMIITSTTFIDVRYNRQSGTGTNISFIGHNLIAKRIR